VRSYTQRSALAKKPVKPLQIWKSHQTPTKQTEISVEKSLPLIPLNSLELK
jgi:hypothetical protein